MSQVLDSDKVKKKPLKSLEMGKNPSSVAEKTYVYAENVNVL